MMDLRAKNWYKEWGQVSGAIAGGGDSGDGEPGGIGGEHRAFRTEPVETFEEAPFEGKAFTRAFDEEVGSGAGVAEIGGRFDALSRGAGVGNAHELRIDEGPGGAVERGHSFVEAFVVQVVHAHAAAGTGELAGYTCAHGSCADDRDG